MANWGIDLGGTKIEGVILPPNGAEPICRIRISTEADQGYEHIVSRVAALVNQMRTETGLEPTSIGIGTPGTRDPGTGLMKGCNTTCLNAKPLPADLAAALGCPVTVANDANCFALAEATLGAAKGVSVVFGIIMGTGVGAGVVVGGHALAGHHGIAGEWGHNVLEVGGTPCYCGKQGCVETVLSGTGLQRFYQERSGEARKLPEIVRRARDQEDIHAVATLERLVAMFGKAIGTVVNILDPDAIVLGGGVGNVDELYQRGHEAAKPWVFNPGGFTTPILRPALGDSAGVFGAAFLVAE